MDQPARAITDSLLCPRGARPRSTGGHSRWISTLRHAVRLALIAATAVGASSATAQRSEAGSDDDFEQTLAKVREFKAAERESMIENELGLTAQERETFWPIYQRYRADIDAIQDRYAALITFFTQNYRSLTDEAALKMIEDYYEIETSTLDTRRRYVAEFETSIPPRKIARFYQLENKIDAIAELPMVMDVPLMGDP
jgi:hypothetical protein